jgi:D-proline reductase (dithiol) PrdB
VLEEHGISTVVVNQNRQQPERIRPPRCLLLHYPYGRPFGQPHDHDQQRVLVEDALNLLVTVSEPGAIVEMPYRWRREDFTAIRQARLPGSQE